MKTFSFITKINNRFIDLHITCITGIIWLIGVPRYIYIHVACFVSFRNIPGVCRSIKMRTQTYRFLLYQTALIAVLYIVGDCVIDESKKAFLLLLQWSWYSKIRGRSLLGLCSTKKINGIWSKIFHFGYSIFVTDFMGLLLHPVYVFWCISAYFNGYIDLKRDNGVTPPDVSGWFKMASCLS